MWLASHAANTHIAVLVVAFLVFAGIVGIVTTHKGNRGKKIKRR